MARTDRGAKTSLAVLLAGLTGSLLLLLAPAPAGAQTATAGPGTSGGALATNDSVASGGCVAVNDSVCSGSGQARLDSTSSGGAVAIDGSVSSGCATAVDDSTASGAPCPAPRPLVVTPQGDTAVRPPTPPARPAPTGTGGGATAGRTLALTGSHTGELLAMAALALVTGAVLLRTTRPA